MLLGSGSPWQECGGRGFFLLGYRKKSKEHRQDILRVWPQWPGSHLLQFPEFLKIMPPAWETQEPVGTFHAYVYFKNLKQWIGNFNWRGNKVHPIFLMNQIPIFIFHKGVFILFLWCWLFKNKEVFLLVINETLGFLFFIFWWWREGSWSSNPGSHALSLHSIMSYTPSPSL